MSIACFLFLSDVKKGFLSTLPKLVSVTHRYSEPGTYILSISADSVVGPLSFLQRSVNIVETPCVINELRMLGTGENSAHCPEIQQEYEYSIYSSLKINCFGVEELKYEWKVEYILSDSLTEAVSFNSEILSSDVLFLAAQSLKGGLYKLTLSVTAMPIGISKLATGFLRVRIPKLLTTIDCGSERVMPWNQEVVLDGSGSRDPNDVNASIRSLSFEWFCDASHAVSCFKGLVNNTEPVLTFPPKFLDSNTSYQFVLSVSKGLRRAKARQTITIVDGSFRPLCVRLVTF